MSKTVQTEGWAEIKQRLEDAKKAGKDAVDKANKWGKDQIAKLKASYDAKLAKVKTPEARKALKAEYSKALDTLKSSVQDKVASARSTSEKKISDLSAKLAKAPKGAKVAAGVAAGAAVAAGGAYAYKKMKDKKKPTKEAAVAEQDIGDTMSRNKSLANRATKFLNTTGAKINSVRLQFMNRINAAKDAATKAKLTQQMKDTLGRLNANKMQYLARLKNPKVAATVGAGAALAAGGAYAYNKMKNKNESYNMFLLKVALGTTITEMSELDKETRLTLLEYVEGADKHQLLNLIIEGGIDEIISTKKKSLLESATVDKKKMFVFEEVRPFVDLI